MGSFERDKPCQSWLYNLQFNLLDYTSLRAHYPFSNLLSNILVNSVSSW